MKSTSFDCTRFFVCCRSIVYISLVCRYYKQHLSKRLLGNSSVSEDSERLMIAKLKMECGFQFTSKLEGMFQDVTVNVQTNQDFEQWLSTNKNIELPLTLEVTVLTTTYWPIPRSTLEGVARMPPLLTRCTEAFTRFYLSKHDGRKLTFHPGLGEMELSAVIGKTRRKITCSVFQVCEEDNFFSALFNVLCVTGHYSVVVHGTCVAHLQGATCSVRHR